jgi:hypothetical protein
VAHIKRDNVASHRAFARAGFVMKGCAPADGRDALRMTLSMRGDR